MLPQAGVGSKGGMGVRMGFQLLDVFYGYGTGCVSGAICPQTGESQSSHNHGRR